MALPIATVATGMPPGIWTMEWRESTLEVAGRHRHPNDGEGSQGGDHTGEVGSASGSGDDDLEATIDGGFGIGDHAIGGAVG